MATANPGLTVALNAAAVDSIWDEAQSGHTTVGTYGGDALRRAIKTITFDGGAGTGAQGAVALFTTTGTVHIVGAWGTCTTLLESAGGGTLALGVTSNAALFIAATTATEIDAGELWVDNSPDANGVALPAALKDIIIADNDEIIGTVATGDITAGVIEIVVLWIPGSSGASVVAA